MPAASAAAHLALKLNGVSPAPGVNFHQVWPAPWMSMDSPPGDHVDDSTALASNSWRGKPRSSTIHRPPAAPSGEAVATAIQWRGARRGPVVKRRVS